MVTIPGQTNSYAQLMEQIEPLQATLLQHGVYRQVKDLSALRVFMEVHVFAVWDFMTLVKSLQRHLTCITLPWLPPTDIHSARLINDIVLAEETDEVAPGHYTSHFELYIQAMREVGANTEPIQTFIRLLREGVPAEQALAELPIHGYTKAFILNTLNSAAGSIPEAAAAFLLGRETVIPSMFRRILDQLEQTHGFTCESFRLYLDRHIHLDEESHAPMGQKLLQNVCGTDPEKWKQALKSAQKALIARYQLWDGTLEAIRELKAGNSTEKKLSEPSPVRIPQGAGNESKKISFARSSAAPFSDRQQTAPLLTEPPATNLVAQSVMQNQMTSHAPAMPSRKRDLLPLVFGMVTLLFVGGLFIFYGNSRRQDINNEATQLQINETNVDFNETNVDFREFREQVLQLLQQR